MAYSKCNILPEQYLPARLIKVRMSLISLELTASRLFSFYLLLVATFLFGIFFSMFSSFYLNHRLVWVVFFFFFLSVTLNESILLGIYLGTKKNKIKRHGLGRDFNKEAGA